MGAGAVLSGTENDVFLPRRLVALDAADRGFASAISRCDVWGIHARVRYSSVKSASRVGRTWIGLTLLSQVAVASAMWPGSPVFGARPGPVQASIAPQATLADNGDAVLVNVTVRCAGGSDVLEAFVYVTQEGNQSPFTPIGVRCGGKARTYAVSVTAPPDIDFHAGAASASAFVLVDKHGDVSSTSPGAAITIA